MKKRTRNVFSKSKCFRILLQAIAFENPVTDKCPMPDQQYSTALLKIVIQKIQSAFNEFTRAHNFINLLKLRQLLIIANCLTLSYKKKKKNDILLTSHRM